jgi:uncharacterized protein (DUF427 family)
MPQRIEPGPGQESVWDYPRPPALDPVDRLVRVVFNGVTVAESRRTIRVLETSHPPVYYFPPGDVQMVYLKQTVGRTFCEYKGTAVYWRLKVGERAVFSAAWSYPDPLPGYEAIRDYLAFYPGRVDEATVDGEQVRPQPGEFYGGWITDEIVGPFKGGPGTQDW